MRGPQHYQIAGNVVVPRYRKSAQWALVVVAAWVLLAAASRPLLGDDLDQQGKSLRVDPTRSTRGYRKEVYIYYVNETALSGQALRNYVTLLDWLASSDQPKPVRIASAVESDVRKFALDADSEVAALQRLCQSPGSRRNVSVIVFTNRNARRGRCAYFRAGDGCGMKTAEFALPARADDDIIYASQPLTDFLTLRAALNKAADLFDPRDHEFILMTKGHGSIMRTLAPRVGADTRERKRKTLLNAVVNGRVRRTSYGVEKGDYCRLLAEVGQERGMFFPVVFMASCKSGLPESIQEQVTNPVELLNVGTLFSSGAENLSFSQNLDYSAVFKDYPEATTFAEAMRLEVTKKLALRRKK